MKSHGRVAGMPVLGALLGLSLLLGATANPGAAWSEAGPGALGTPAPGMRPAQESAATEQSRQAAPKPPTLLSVTPSICVKPGDEISLKGKNLGGSGNDYVQGDDGNNQVYGDAGTDDVYGGGGDDTRHQTPGGDSYNSCESTI